MNGSGEASRLVTAAAQRRDLVLDLSNHGLKALPEGLREITHLSELLLNGNKLECLPDWLGELTSLRRLHLGRNRLTSLPDSLRSLVRLTSLHLGGNQLAQLPVWLGDFVGLESLHLESNGLVEVPEWLLNLHNLYWLDLGGNRLAELPGWFSGLQRLSTVHLYRNRMTHLPESIRGLSGLTALYLNGNRLTALPEWLGELSGLIRLHLYGNKLTTLPDSIRNLTNLTVLDLKGNCLGELPESLQDLTSLATLDLDSNNLRTLPEWAGDLTGLTRLAIQDNPLRSPPQEIRAAGTSSTLAFLRALQRGSDKQWHSKLLVVGEARVGKTSIAAALRGLPFDPQESPTRGVDIATLDLEPVPPVGAQAQLSMWDFGGQLEYRATQRFYLTDRSLFLLAWNVEGGPETHGRVAQWLETIQSAAPESPVIIVGTHSTGRVSDLDEAGLRHRYPNVAEILQVDCKDGTGIPELRQHLAALAVTLPLMGQPWPRAWTAAARRLTDQPGKFITIDQATTLLRKSGVEDSTEHAALLAVLHDRGEILHFTQADLRETVILQPAWVDEMVTRVLDSKQVFARGGLLSRAHRAELWADIHDTGMRDTLLAVMERFRLAYRIGGPDDEDIALIVERLPPGEPTSVRRQWNEARTETGVRELRVTYRLPSRPAGIPSWFIAQEHRFSTGMAWAHGALLRRPEDGYGIREAWALLEDDCREQPTIRLAVCGIDPLDFRQTLDEGFRCILDHYPGLRYEKLVPCICGEESGTTCGHEFNYDEVHRFVDQARPKIQCYQTGIMVDPRELLYGLRPYREQADLANIRTEIAEFRAEVRSGLHKIDNGQLWQRNRIRDLLQLGRADEVDHYPRLFTVTEIGLQRYELHMWCENPDRPHPLPEDIGVHRFVKKPDWLRPYAPYLLFALRTLVSLTPLVGPALGAAGEQLSNVVQNDLQLSTSLLQELAGHHITTIDVVELDKPPRGGGEINALYQQLLQITKGFSGLYPREIPEYKDSVFYLCADHRRQLEQPAHNVSET